MEVTSDTWLSKRNVINVLAVGDGGMNRVPCKVWTAITRDFNYPRKICFFFSPVRLALELLLFHYGFSLKLIP